MNGPAQAPRLALRQAQRERGCQRWPAGLRGTAAPSPNPLRVEYVENASTQPKPRASLARQKRLAPAPNLVRAEPVKNAWHPAQTPFVLSSSKHERAGTSAATRASTSSARTGVPTLAGRLEGNGGTKPRPPSRRVRRKPVAPSPNPVRAEYVENASTQPKPRSC